MINITVVAIKIQTYRVVDAGVEKPVQNVRNQFFVRGYQDTD